MANLLVAPGLVRPNRYLKTQEIAERVRSCQGPMPDGQPLIQTEKGVHWIELKEWGRGLGVKGYQLAHPDLTTGILPATTSVYIWEYLGLCLSATYALEGSLQPIGVGKPPAGVLSTTEEHERETLPNMQSEIFEWSHLI
ncbi:hypothetical protein ACA910_009668 [Epithemia clementina (nom. ined.)]